MTKTAEAAKPPLFTPPFSVYESRGNFRVIDAKSGGASPAFSDRAYADELCARLNAPLAGELTAVALMGAGIALTTQAMENGVAKAIQIALPEWKENARYGEPFAQAIASVALAAIISRLTGAAR